MKGHDLDEGAGEQLWYILFRLEKGEEVYLGMGQGSTEELNRSSSANSARNSRANSLVSNGWNSLRNGRANSLVSNGWNSLRNGRADSAVNSAWSSGANSFVHSGRSGRMANSLSMIAASRTFPAVLTVQMI